MKKIKLLLLVGLVVVLASTQIAMTSPSLSSYDPWLDLNDDGVNDVNDLYILAWIYGTSGTPINKTELLLDLQERVGILNATLYTDYYDKSDSDVRFVNVIGDTMTGALYVPIVFDKDNSVYYVNPAGGTSALLAGNVGVGTSSPYPNTRLHVTGDLYGVRGEGSGWGGYFWDTDGTSSVYLASADYGIYSPIGTRNYFAGSIGVGTATPGARLHATGGSYGVQGEGSGWGGYFRDTTGTSSAYLAYGDYGIYSPVGTRNYFAGSVGIGTSSPAANTRLHVTGNTYGVRGEGYIWGGYFSAHDGIGWAVLGFDLAGQGQGYGISAGGDTYGGVFEDNDGTSQAILAYEDYGIWTQAPKNYFSGNVGIGGVDPARTLHVHGPIRWDGTDFQEFTFLQTMSATNYIECYSGEEGAYVGISYWISTRDSKKNFQPLSEVVDSNKIYDLEPLSFHYKSDPDDARKSIGLIAEDTAEILPEIVSYDDEGNPHHINYGLLGVLNLDQLQKIRKGITVDEDGKVGIGTTSPDSELDVAGYVQATGCITGDMIFQEDGEKLWRMFEEEDGLYLESLKTGKVYSFVLQEVGSERLVESANSYLKPSGLHINATTGLTGLVIALGLVLGLTRYRAKNSKEELDAQQTTLSQWQ